MEVHGNGVGVIAAHETGRGEFYMAFDLQGSSSRKIKGPDCQHTNLKQRRIKFTGSTDLLLLKVVMNADAHLFSYVEAKSRFTQAVDLFLASALLQTFHNTKKPSWKTLQDRFKRIVWNQRDTMKRSQTASEIIENRVKPDQLPEDVDIVMDEFEKTRCAMRDKQAELDKRLQSAGENFRKLAVSK